MPKRLAIFCDGTWNQLAHAPTNVVLGSQMLLPYSDDGVQQLIFYKQGVGTSYVVSQKLESWLAGAFGWGLFDNIADAYRFLVFNYRTGDEIYIFGFSRGAFTARSLAGMIRRCGIVPRDRLDKVEEAFSFYRERSPDSKADQPRAQRFRAENAPEIIMDDTDRAWRKANGYKELYEDLPNFTIKYLGVWDTVGALGVPKYLLFEQLLHTAAKYQFHDLDLSPIVESARHAVALDETRLSFAPTTWENLSELNALRPGNYEQMWFPGDHGSVGGGGEIRDLSSAALGWIMAGAQKAGLALDEAAVENAARDVHPEGPLRNVTKDPGLLDAIMQRGDRTGPLEAGLLSASAVDRLNAEAKQAGWSKYRPRSILPLLRTLFPDEQL